MTIQISNFHVSDRSSIVGTGKVALVTHRKDPNHSGVFDVNVNVTFNPALPAPNDYPTGFVKINVDLTDSFKGSAVSTSIEQVNTFGKDTPMSVITGRCNVNLQGSGTAPRGCSFWLLIANNKRPHEQGTPNIFGFVVYDNNGNRIAYGTGPSDEDIEVAGFAL